MWGEGWQTSSTRLRFTAPSCPFWTIGLESRYGPEGVRDFDLFIERAGVVLVPVDAEQSRLARHAFVQFGRGRHEAGLNFGDCFSYALAMILGEPLLFKGDDFSRTDVGCVGL